MVIAARIQFAPLFYSFSHPKYQQLHLQDEYIWQRVQMPQEIKEYISTNESFSVSGRENLGQGGDFVHEELKKRIKALLPRILPTADIWSRICRKLPDLEEIRDNTIRPKESRSRYKNHVNEITLVRREIQSNMTISFNPEKTLLMF